MATIVRADQNRDVLQRRIVRTKIRLARLQGRLDALNAESNPAARPVTHPGTCEALRSAEQDSENFPLPIAAG